MAQSKFDLEGTFFFFIQRVWSFPGDIIKEKVKEIAKGFPSVYRKK